MSKSTFDSFTSIDILEEGTGNIPFIRISEMHLKHNVE